MNTKETRCTAAIQYRKNGAKKPPNIQGILTAVSYTRKKFLKKIPAHHLISKAKNAILLFVRHASLVKWI